MTLSDSDVRKIVSGIIKKKDKFSYYLYGIITKGVMNVFCVFLFTDARINVIEVAEKMTVVNNIPIQLDAVEKLEFDKWLFGMGRRIKIFLKDGNGIEFKVNKFTIGMKKQKEYLTKIEEEYRKLGLVK